MIRHVVMWRFKDSAEGKTRLENMERVREDLYSLVPIIPEIQKMEIGFDVSKTDMSMDLMLLTEFDSPEALKIYATHSEHLKVGQYIRSVTESRVVLDCEI